MYDKPSPLRAGPRRSPRFIIPLLALVLFAPALSSRAETPVEPAPLLAVVIGDSLSAGFQSGSLLDRQQVHGYASLVAAQAQVPLPLPLIGEPGIPPVLRLIDPGPPPVIERSPGMSLGRTNPDVQPLNLAVTGANVQDALTTRPDLPIDGITDLVLGLPDLFAGISRSQVEWAEALAPDAIVVWLGSNDMLGAVLNADTAFLTPLPEFERAYREVMERLAATGAALIVANIPDVTAIPYLTSAEQVAEFVGLPLDVIGFILGIGRGDFVTPEAFEVIEGILGGRRLPPLPKDVVLDAGEADTIRAAVVQANAVIALQALEKGAALLDTHSLFELVQAAGIVVGGRHLTTRFLGGLFSLDGVHPTNTGYALIANEFVRTINTAFHTGILPVSVEEVANTDPLVLPGVEPSFALEHLSADTAQSLRQMLGH